MAGFSPSLQNSSLQIQTFLVNVNGGQKILVRLRPAAVPDTFYDEEDVVQTMLHELTHNVHGPHDEKFYKLLAELEDEYAALKRSGYSGEGFFSKGTRLGQGASHDIPPHLARAKALEAAEKRRKTGIMLGGSRRLGGSNANAGRRSPRELAAEAAELRAQDEKSCQVGEVAVREADKAAKESVENMAIDLTGDSDDEAEVQDKTSILKSAPPLKTTTVRLSHVDVRVGRDAERVPMARKSASRSRSRLPQSKLTPTPVPPPSPMGMADALNSRSTQLYTPSVWECPRCTLVNQMDVLSCAACTLIRPTSTLSSVADGWTCGTCKEEGIPHQFWTCRFCGSVKTQSTMG
ncbi:WLM domain-containing protein [Cristinia sonorae]|uniref:WLM domain-containing protein n=1 Tax=Cristinia sonorae TaxID=1940300 RepID=A0A8K0USS4_9AGAR|nr:WLM domain-containing protein [Cristinia sonorae]